MRAVMPTSRPTRDGSSGVALSLLALCLLLSALPSGSDSSEVDFRLEADFHAFEVEESSRLVAADAGEISDSLADDGKPLLKGDYAKWKKADDDLPAGSIGEVIGFKKNGRIRLRFSPEKTYSFHTKNVLRASEVEVTAYKKQVAAGWPTGPPGCAAPDPEQVLAFGVDAMAGRKTRAEVK